MITELTKEQNIKKELWQKEWFKIGSSIDPANKPLAEKSISSLYALLGKKAPEFIWVSSPFEAKKVLIKNGKTEEVPNFVIGQENSYWVNFYLFLLNVLKLKAKHEDVLHLSHWEGITRSCFWFWPFEHVVVVSDRPEQIHWNNALPKVLHNPNGPAVRFRDGSELYALNGITMNKEDVMTAPEKIDCKKVLKRQNVDQRRELIRKIGIERMLTALNPKVLDQKDNYALLEIKLSNEVTDAKYLKMKNPSIGIWHVEGVARECKTVSDAINWRAGDINKQWKPIQLT